MADKMKTAACEAIDKAAEELHQLSDQIWSKPELGFEEHFAHEVLTKFLTRHGFPVEPKFSLDTAFRATYGSDTGTNVAILCEYDALPGIGHACGHNLIAEVGVAAALGVKAALDQSTDELGKLTILGTPAEEGGGGKQLLLDAGAFKHVDAAMIAHPYPRNVFGNDGITALTQMVVTYRGKASHAASFPWEGVNALDAAVMAYNNISCLRQQMKPTWRIHGVITNGGTKPNIIPELTSSHYVIRARTKAELAVLKEKVILCFEAAATATGCQVEVKYPGIPYDDMVTNKTFVEAYTKNATELGLQEPKVQFVSRGSTDMGNVSHVVPSIHPMFYIGTDAPNHTRPMAEAAGDPKAQPYTLLQAKALACTAIDVMREPGIMQKMKNDLAEVTSLQNTT